MARFSRPVHLVDGDAVALLPRLEHLGGQHVAAAVAVLEGAEVVLVEAVVFENHPVKGRNAEHPAHLVPLYGFQRCIDLRRRHEDDAIAEVEAEGDGEALCHDMEEGVHHEHHLFALCHAARRSRRP